MKEIAFNLSHRLKFLHYAPSYSLPRKKITWRDLIVKSHTPGLQTFSSYRSYFFKSDFPSSSDQFGMNPDLAAVIRTCSADQRFACLYSLLKDQPPMHRELPKNPDRNLPRQKNSMEFQGKQNGQSDLVFSLRQTWKLSLIHI